MKLNYGKLTDVVGIPLAVGDLVYDYSFCNLGTIEEYNAEQRHFIVRIKSEDGKSFCTIKEGGSLMSLEPHRVTNPELFL